MKKIIVLFIVVVMGVFISCQKDYVCYCTKPNTNVSSYRETYKGTVFAKKAANKSCKDNMNIELDSLTNCYIE
ncbi:MAG: hypothetical protein IPH32_12550 [Bacteroidetes bacterium]|jgi:hypothetical protein|nr:hypothetical protein [Bacteroidota bacterium]